jgi:aarF domain-containing kinase
LKQDVLPPSYLDPKRQPKSRAAALAPTILNHPPVSVPTAAVAIKVLHPRVENLIARDLSIMHFIARLLSIFPGMEWISLPEEVQVFGRMMNEQLDLRNEAVNLDHFERNFASRRVPVTFPRPLKIWSTRDVLVEEFQTALPLEAFLKNGGGPFDDQIAEIGLDAFLVERISLLDWPLHYLLPEF